MDSQDLWWSASVPWIYTSWKTCRCVNRVVQVYFELSLQQSNVGVSHFSQTAYPFENLPANLMLWWGTIIVLESKYTMSWWFWLLVVQFVLWNLARVCKSWADSPFSHFYLCIYQVPLFTTLMSFSFSQPPQKTFSSSCSSSSWSWMREFTLWSSCFCCFTSSVWVAACFLPLIMAHMMSPSQAVLCNRDISHLLRTECTQKVLVCFHFICSGSLPKKSVQISRGHSMADGGDHPVPLPAQSRFRALSSWVLSVSQSPQPLSATRVWDRHSVWPPSEPKSSFLH